MKYRLTHKVCEKCNKEKQFKEFYDSGLKEWCYQCWDTFIIEEAEEIRSWIEKRPDFKV
jgi:hypothetical protein